MKVLFLRDRISTGFVSGIIAGLAMNIPDHILSMINLDDQYLFDWAAIVIFGRLPKSLGEFISAQMYQLFFSGFLGIFFSYLLLRLPSGNYLLRGWIYGVASWFFIYAFAIAFRLPYLETHSLNSVLSHNLSASIYGLVLAETLHRINSKNSL